MDSQIEEIKSKLSVVDVVGSYMKLAKTGANFRGVCPFHSEKKPSFFVSPARDLWHCFGCGAGSSIFDFVMKIEGVEFGDALRILANKAGVELKRENVQLRTERQRLYEICELACKFFEKQLEGGVGKEAEEYLLKRGIAKESIKKWRLGNSPDTWNGLSDFLIGKGYKREEVVKAGLAIQKEQRNDSYDRFRGRIMFPVFDLNSQPVGFGGRVFKQGSDKEIAKYINTPQTLLYDKSGILYGLNNAKLAIRKQNQCVVTEGYTDVIMCHQAGYENTVGASGTALTSQHMVILKRYSEKLILAFDMDIAGDSATKRGINGAQEQGFDIKIIETYLKNADPADIIVKDPAAWEQAVAQARGIMDYYFDSAFAAFNKNAPEGKRDIGKILLPVIKRLPNKIEQSYWIQKLSEMLGVKEEAVMEELVKTQVAERSSFARKDAKMADSGQDEVLGTEGRKKLIEEKVISLILKNTDYVKLIDEAHYAFFSEKTRNFLQKLSKIIEEQKPLAEGELVKDFRAIFDSLLSSKGEGVEAEFNSEVKNFLAALALRADADYQEDGQEEMSLCLLQLKNIELKNKLNKISEDIKKAEQENDHQKVNALIAEFNALTKEL